LSSEDHVADYQGASQFCDVWGGELLVLEDKAEFQLIFPTVKDQETVWYGRDSDSPFANPVTPLKPGHCNELIP